MAKKSINEHNSYTGDPSLLNILVQEKSQSNPAEYEHRKADLGAILDGTYGEIKDSFTLCMGALANYLTQLRVLITQMVFSTSDSNGSNTLQALDEALTTLTNSSQAKRKILKSLSHCSLSNSASLVIDGTAYTSTLTADEAYKLNSVSITMGSVDITESVWDANTGTISIASVTGDVVIIAEAVEEYTAETIYSNYTSDGNRFYTRNIEINFDRGDYVEAILDCSSSDVVNNSNVFGISKNLTSSGGTISTDYLEYNNGEAILFFKRNRGSSYTENFSCRIRDAANEVDTTRWATVSDLSNIRIKIHRGSIDINDTHFGGASGINDNVLGFVTAENTISLGACSSTRSPGVVYSSIKVYRKN